MLAFHATGQYKRDYRKAMRQHQPMDILDEVITTLLNRKPLAAKFRNHLLIDDYRGRHECHIKPDWLLIYHIEGNQLICERVGSHSELFE